MDTNTLNLTRRMEVYLAMLDQEGERFEGDRDELVSEDAIQALDAALQWAEENNHVQPV